MLLQWQKTSVVVIAVDAVVGYGIDLSKAMARSHGGNRRVLLEMASHLFFFDCGGFHGRRSAESAAAAAAVVAAAVGIAIAVAAVVASTVAISIARVIRAPPLLQQMKKILSAAAVAAAG